MEQQRSQRLAPSAAPLPPRPAAATLATPPPARGGRRPGPVKVKIDTPGATIEIEAEGDLGTVTAEALRLFTAAGGWPQHPGHAVGFAGTDRRPTFDAHEPINTGGAR